MQHAITRDSFFTTLKLKSIEYSFLSISENLSNLPSKNYYLRVVSLLEQIHGYFLFYFSYMKKRLFILKARCNNKARKRQKKSVFFSAPSILKVDKFSSPTQSNHTHEYVNSRAHLERTYSLINTYPLNINTLFRIA